MGRGFTMGHTHRRPRMVRLFSTILKREGDDFFLVTPVEKVGIRVVDAPFIAPRLCRDRHSAGSNDTLPQMSEMR